MKRLILLGALALSLGRLASSVQAGIVLVPIGTAPPPATLGGYPMTQYGPDSSAEFATVTGVAPTPSGGALGFSIPMQHLIVGSSWGTWSNGYTGDVYWTQGATDVTMTLTPGVSAFDFYAEPNPFQSFDITATASDGSTLTQTVSGSGGAAGYGLYGTGGDTIVSVEVSSSVDFAVGEFAESVGTVVPEPASLTLLAVGGLSALGCRWLRRKKMQLAIS